MADSSFPRRFPVGEGLPPGARSLLEELGLAERFDKDNHRRSLGNVSAWGSMQLAVTDFIWHPAGHGYQLDRACFDAMLREAAADKGANVRLTTRLSLFSAGDSKNRHKLLLERRDSSAELVEASWLLDAGGSTSTLSLRLGAQRYRLDTMVSFALLFERSSATLCADEDSRTMVESVESGWWYSALLPSGCRLAVYLTDSDLVEAKTATNASGLLALLAQTRHIGPMLVANSYTATGRPQGLGAATASLDRSAGVRWLAVGDAAYSFDPLSSKGISQALYDGIRSARAIDSALSGDADKVHAHACLQRQIFHTYLEQRRDIYRQEMRWMSSPFWKRRTG
jgi:flavin-dependent dehydrogenase